MSLFDNEDPVEMIRQSGADPQVLGRIWEHYRDRLRRVVRLRLDRRATQQDESRWDVRYRTLARLPRRSARLGTYLSQEAGRESLKTDWDSV